MFINRLLKSLLLFLFIVLFNINFLPLYGYDAAPDSPQGVSNDLDSITVVLPSIYDYFKDETIKIPNGRPIYAFLVSGFHQNSNFELFHWYNFAKCLQKHGAYVHFSWWNNLLAPYMERPLHDPNSRPSTGAVPFAQVLGNPGIKAYPPDDFQFQADIDTVLTAIREHNPDAVIILVGHSMGGDAIARLASNPDFDIDIDLLAPIDPVGNRNFIPNSPESVPPNGTVSAWENFTRWRATHLDYVGTDENPPSLRTFGENIKYLYHRWQTEFLPPFTDYDKEYFFVHPDERVADINSNRTNVQSAVKTNKKSGIVVHPNWWWFYNWGGTVDGHGEIVGFSGTIPGTISDSYPLALRAGNKWPSGHDTKNSQDRVKYLKDWEDNPEFMKDQKFEPSHPHLCMVSNDLCEILEKVILNDPGDSITIPEPANGAGTVENPYQITTIEELNFIRTNLDKHYRLMNNLDFTGSNYDKANSSYGWNPIGINFETAFTGSFNGAGHTISNLYINRSNSDYIGLFAYTLNAKVDSLSVINCYIAGNKYTGSLMGYCNSSEVSNCFAEGSLFGHDKTGGLVGASSSSARLSNCYAAVNIYSNHDYAGGLVGHSYNSNISNCYATGIVLGNDRVGGLLGYSSDGSTTTNIYATGTVTGNSSVGGLVGHNDNVSTITNGYYNVETSEEIKGIGMGTGDATGLTTTQMTQSSSYNFDFSAEWNITYGETFPRIDGLHNIPIVLPGLSSVIKVDRLYNDTILLIPMDDPNPAITLQVKPDRMEITDNILTWTPDSLGNFLIKYHVTDYMSYAVSAYSHVWHVVPYKGEGTKNNPFQVSTIEGLDFIRTNPDKHYRLMNNLDFAGSTYDTKNSLYGWDPIGMSYITAFTGSFNGAGHSIVNLYINRPEENYIGLFGYIAGAAIDSLAVIQSSITGNNYVGSITGYNHSTDLSYCYATGSLSGYDKIGGLAGANTTSATISNCYSSVKVYSHNNYAGGLVGHNYRGHIRNCYSTGNVSGNDRVGGVLGYNSNGSTLNNSYAVGRITGNSRVGGLVGQNSATINKCYFNSETSDKSTGIGAGTGDVYALLTAAMKQEYSFEEFDFDTTWAIRQDSTYPALQAVDNAPFGFADVVYIAASKSLDTLSRNLLTNDYDYETIQELLLCRIDSLSAGRLEDGVFYLHDTASEGDTIIIYYQVGKKRTQDTLWGNITNVEIVVLPNSAPVLNGLLQTNEDVGLRVGINSCATDNEGDFICLDLIIQTKNGSITVEEDTLTYVPKVNFYGSDSVQISLSDGLLCDTSWVLITVNAVNDSPVINSMAPLTATVGEIYTYSVDATDVDDDELTYTLGGAPEGMMVDGNIITWTPSNGTTTTGQIILTVSDGELSDMEIFTISVSGGTGIEDIGEGGITLYPNPANDKLIVQSNSIIENIKVITVSGRVELNEPAHKTVEQLDLHKLEPGLYIIQIKTSNSTVFCKLCKE